VLRGHLRFSWFSLKETYPLHCIHFFSEDLCFSSHILPGSQFGYMASEPAAERNTGDALSSLSSGLAQPGLRASRSVQI
jgi:hypothetical protein